jgi:1,4-dihydroxy-2-naphthoate polyprenyltransferase
MTYRTFLELVEIRTKLASLFPFIVGVLFAMTYFGEVQWLNTFIFFIGMTIFDMVTTMINNYMDFKKAKSKTYQLEENIIGQSGIPLKLVRHLILIMLLMTMGIGIYLTGQNGGVFMLIGGICCLVGVFYTWGPIPLSRMPLGEIFSGLSMGLGIFILTILTNVTHYPPVYLQLNFSSGLFQLEGNLYALAAIILASLPLISSISNIMLANNLRDLTMDIENHRYTLIYYIGRPTGVSLFKFLALLGYGTIIIGLLAGIYQWPILVTLASFPIVLKNTQAFEQALPHPRCFQYAIKNLVTFNTLYALGLALSLLITGVNF